MRRIYLDSIAIRPRIKVSGAFIAFGSGPVTESGWLSAEAYWRVYQDWRGWTKEGIIDVAIPMIYQCERVASGRTAFDRWNDWVRNHQYGRSALMGTGAFLNSIDGTLPQVRRAIAPSAAGNRNLGVNFFSMATSNVAVAPILTSLSDRGLTPRRRQGSPDLHPRSQPDGSGVQCHDASDDCGRPARSGARWLLKLLTPSS